MVIDNRVVRLVVVSLLVLLLIPLLAMLGMMLFGGPMMAEMSGQMGGMMSGGVMALCVLWTVLVSAALIFLIVTLARGDPSKRERTTTANIPSPLPH